MVLTRKKLIESSQIRQNTKSARRLKYPMLKSNCFDSTSSQMGPKTDTDKNNVLLTLDQDLVDRILRNMRK